MKTRNKIMLGALLIAPLFTFSISAVPASAQEQGRGNSRVAQTTTTKPELTEEEKKALQERLTKRKAEMKVRLTAAEKQRLQTRCKNSTGKISELRGRIKGIETSRAQVYENLVNRLTKLSTRLQERGVDTTELDSQITELQEKIATFTTDLAAYKVAVGDLEDMDCAADAESFKASLEAARAAREKIKVDIADIKTYVNDTIKATLKEIRTALVKEDGSESTDSDESGSDGEQQEGTNDSTGTNETQQTTNEGNE
jgi:predicted  nucleic acid-binding Zn-ribbon protein